MIALGGHSMLASNVLLDPKYRCLPTDAAQPELSSSVSEESAQTLPCLPRGSIVVVRGNQRTKKSLVGQTAVVKRSVGLGGWHHCVSGDGGLQSYRSLG